MCVSSMVMDHYRDKWLEPNHPFFTWTTPGTYGTPLSVKPEITRAEFDELKRDIEEMKAPLIRAKKYDADNNEPDCEMGEKVALVRKIAKLVGVDLSEVF